MSEKCLRKIKNYVSEMVIQVEINDWNWAFMNSNYKITSLIPVVWMTWSKSVCPRVLFWMVNSSSDSKVVTRTLVGRDGIFGLVLKIEIIWIQNVKCMYAKSNGKSQSVFE